MSGGAAGSRAGGRAGRRAARTAGTLTGSAWALAGTALGLRARGSRAAWKRVPRRPPPGVFIQTPVAGEAVAAKTAADLPASRGNVSAAPRPTHASDSRLAGARKARAREGGAPPHNYTHPGGGGTPEEDRYGRVPAGGGGACERASGACARGGAGLSQGRRGCQGAGWGRAGLRV